MVSVRNFDFENGCRWSKEEPTAIASDTAHISRMKGSIPLMLSQNKAVVMYYCVGCLMQNNVKEETCDF
jgi:hypothetical protein